jgi:nitrogen regulatory protein PII
MRKVEAVVREDKVEDVKRALNEAGFAGLTVYLVKG